METRVNGSNIAVFIDFENVATSAEANLGDFDVSTVIDLLRARGRLLIKRAYGDWGRFHRYRRAMLENGIDLIQLYSVGVQQKNRADVRLALDALEAVFTRDHIDVYAIVSGDSDFTELIHKLRDHGKYTIGIGLRSATSDLLRRACDEFVFYDTLVAEDVEDLADELHLPDPGDLLRRALAAAEQKGELPVFAGRLKQIMLGLDASFNEANYGFQQFRTFLEAHTDLVALDEHNQQLYVRRPAPPRPAVIEPPAAPIHEPVVIVPPPPVKPVTAMGQRYRNFLREAGLRVVELAARQQVVADFLALVQAAGAPMTLAAAADQLKDRYDAGNAVAQKIAVPDVLRLLLIGGVLRFAGNQPGSDAPVQPIEATSESLLRACDAAYVWRLVEGGLAVYPDQLARVIYDAATDPATVVVLCKYLEGQSLIVPAGDTYGVHPRQVARFLERKELAEAAANMQRVALPAGEPISVLTAENLFREGSDLRQKDFAGSAQRYLQAARIQWEALRSGPGRAGFDDLRWYIASYCSVKAGHAFVTGNYAEAAPYYLAFFGLAREDDSVWPRIQRLVTPMASYFFAIAGRQLNEAVPPNLGRSPACQVAWRIHNHANSQVSALWEELMSKLATVNLGLIRQTYRDLTGLIAPTAQAGGENTAAIERTRGYLAGLIAEREGNV
jgi:uncharacterized protein (TIGR00288 family)